MKTVSKALALSVMLMLSACIDAPPASSPKTELTFAQMQSIPLHVARVEVIDEFKSPVSGGHVEHLFPIAPSVAVKDLLAKKLSAEGVDNILRVIITDASVKEEKLAVTEDFLGNFRREPSERYNARVALRFELVNEQAPDIVIGNASVIGQRTKTVLEDTSPADRDRAYLLLTEELMTDVYNGLDTVVRDTFGRK